MFRTINVFWEKFRLERKVSNVIFSNRVPISKFIAFAYINLLIVRNII